MIKALTDYPFTELGDQPGKIAPTRTIDVVWYDRDKYVGIVLPDGQRSSIKAGYCYALGQTISYDGKTTPKPNIGVRNLPLAMDWEEYDANVIALL